ncbi:procathepsin L-like [Thunnus maccoyii]|uniref:procathepsin L-like n=1 Tax=Thunnus maccoyii TaxID=8240 RepID=UPI001C4C45A9|nr:procathepsin L-like [Thunnus maccoyii]
MLLCVCMLLLVVSDLGFCLDEASLDNQWKQWKIKYGKEYNIRIYSRRQTGARRSCSRLQQLSEDEEYRRAIWEKNMLMIEAHNQEAEQGKHTYRLGMNLFGDMTSKEMAEKMTYHRVPSNYAKSSYCKGQTTGFFYKTGVPNPEVPQCKKDFKGMTLEEKVYNMTCPLKLPKFIDYREKGMVTQVKDQGSSGSCWAFSAVGALEGQLAKKTGKLLDLSPQNLVDCVTKCNGCRGGQMIDAFKYVQDNGGMNSDKDYPYIGEKQPCSYNASAITAQCKGFKKVPEGDECALAKALYEVGPLSVAIDSSQKEFMFYESGVYYDPECDKDNINHAVLLVGYGETREGLKYWIVKNSFGESWGKEGYIQITRDHNNHCGIASDVSYPLV